MSGVPGFTTYVLCAPGYALVSAVYVVRTRPISATKVRCKLATTPTNPTHPSRVTTHTKYLYSGLCELYWAAWSWPCARDETKGKGVNEGRGTTRTEQMHPTLIPTH